MNTRGSEQFPMFNFSTFRDYQMAHPAEARTVIAVHAFRTLGNLDHDLFFDAGIYDQLQGTLGSEEVINHPGILLYEQEVKEKRATLGGSRAASDRELPTYIQGLIDQLEEELSQWRAAEPEESVRSTVIVETILQGDKQTLSKHDVIQAVEESVFQLPGIALAFQIRVNREKLQQSSKTSSTPGGGIKMRTGKSAKEHLEEYLRNKGET